MPNPNSSPTKENPNCAGDAIGVKGDLDVRISEAYRNRAEAATALCHAIADCHPEDACILMEAALLDLGAGAPIPPLFSVRDAATDWAEWASNAELKAYALACYNRLRPADRSAFLAYVGRAA